MTIFLILIMAFGHVPASTPLVTMRKSPLHVLGRTVPFTVRLWFKLDSLSAGITTDFAGGIGWFVQTEGGNVFINGPEAGAAHPLLLFSATDWNHFVGGFDGERMFAHLNGSARAFSDPMTQAHELGPRFALSVNWVRQPPATDTPHASLDEVALWKDRVLSAADVADDYAAGVGVNFAATDQDGLLAYWELEGVDGTDADDLVDSVAGRILHRQISGTGNSSTYGAGKFGEGLYNGAGVSGSAFDGTRFESVDPVFTFGT